MTSNMFYGIILMVFPWYRQCTAAVYIQSIPSFPTCYGRSNRNACIPSMMTCHSRFSWTALLFSSIHSYTKLLHHQMLTCMFAEDEGSLSVFHHMNSFAMHLNMSQRLPGFPQSLPDGTVAQKAELKPRFRTQRRLKQGTNAIVRQNLLSHS